MSRPQKSCMQCGKAFTPGRRAKDYIQRFCSCECHWNSKRKTIVCDNCGKEATKPQSFVKSHGRHFCNKKCHNEANFSTGYVDPRGYIRFTITGHPMAGSKGYILEHWFVMYTKNPALALYAKENEWTIHHRNGIRGDNRLENLEWRLPGRHPQGWTIDAMVETVRRAGYNVEPTY